MKKYRIRKGSVADVTVTLCKWTLYTAVFAGIMALPLVIGIVMGA